MAAYKAGFKILRSVVWIFLIYGHVLLGMMLQDVSNTAPQASLAAADQMIIDDDPRNQMSKELVGSSVIAEGDDEGAQYYLEHGADPNVKDYKRYDQRPLHKAISTHQIDIVKILLEHPNIDINARTARGEASLHIAAKEGLIEVIMLLLKKGADIRSRTVNGQTALHYAVEANKPEAVKQLIEAGVYVDAPNGAGATPLFYAVLARNYAMVELLLCCRANVKRVMVETRLTVLHVAAQYGDARMVELLIKGRARVNAQDRCGVTPLHCAVESGDLDTIRVLAHGGANCSAKDAYGKLPLDYEKKGGDALEKIRRIIDPEWVFRENNLIHEIGLVRDMKALTLS